MIRNVVMLRDFEHSLARSEPVDFCRNLRIFEALYREARSLAIIPLRNPLDEIDADIRLAGVLNARESAPSDRSRT